VREGKTTDPRMIQSAKRRHQPLDDHIMENVRMKRITPEDAYDKALGQEKISSAFWRTARGDDN